MKRLTKRDTDWPAWPLLDRPRGALCTAKFCALSDRCGHIGDRTCPYLQIVDRLAAIEDILGDEYDLERLRELAQADREGRCVVLNMPREPLVWGDDDQDTCLCPYCGKDLMGIPYEERMVLQCPECGQYLDATKVITREDAEAALRREQDE